MKKEYTNPQIYVENVVIESGIATSGWGEPGWAGPDGSVEDYEGEL